MAVTDTSRPTSAASRLGGPFRLINAFVAWNELRRTRKALSRLSDRELDDIGLSRGDIDHMRL